MSTVALAAVGTGILLFLYSYVKMWQALRQTEGRIGNALLFLFFTSISYVLSAGVASLFVALGTPLDKGIWLLVPASGIFTGLLWAKSAADWPVIVRQARIMQEVARKAGGNG